MPTLDNMLEELADAFSPIVAAIEAAPALTRWRYDQYMAAIERITSMTGNKANSAYLATGLGLIRAGANREGVVSALRAMGKLDSEMV